jgi:Tol biopolymer transport system component
MKKVFKIILYTLLGVVLVIACFIGYNVVVMKMNETKTDSGGTFHPNGEFIVYASKASGDFEIYSINLTGKKETRLTFNDKSDDLYPSFSPIGEWIAFVAKTNDETDLFLMDFEGKNTKRLTNVKNVYNGSFCSWSPDGQTIAFVSSHEGNNEVYTINLDGSNLTNLTKNKSSDGFPSWSPDGERIVFSSDRNESNSLFVMTRDGSDVTQVTNNTNDIAPDWSAATNKIIFQRRLSRFKSQLFSIDPNGENLKSISSGDDLEFYPKWSPDGTRILFTAGDMTNSDLFYMDIKTKDVIQLTID